MNGEFLLVIGILLLVFFPDIRVRVVGALIAGIQLFALFTVQDALIDVGIDTAVVAAEEFDLIDLPDSVCPTEFNRGEYCAEFGLDKGDLTGQIFLKGEINENVGIRVETKEKIVRCDLTKGKGCNVPEIKSTKDFRVTLC